MNTFEIDDLLERMASEGRNHFAPHYVCERLNYSLDQINSVADYLLSLSGRKLIPLFEVECPEGDCDFVIDNPLLLDNEYRTCSYCGTEYIPDPDRIWLCFNFTNDYLEHVKKKNALKQSPEEKLICPPQYVNRLNLV